MSGVYTQPQLIGDQKRCIGCQCLRPLSEFSIDRRNRDGRVSRCKSCHRAAYAANPEPARERARRQAAADPESNRRRAREWAAANREASRQRAREWAAANPDRKRAATKLWQERNLDRVRDNRRRWLAENPDKNREYQRKWRERNPEWVRSYHESYRAVNVASRRVWYQNYIARKHGAGHVAFTADQLAAKVAYWGDCCWVCGGAFEAIDHVKPLAKGGAHCLANLRPICTSCNSRKSDKWPFTK